MRDINGIILLAADEAIRADATVEGLAKLKPSFAEIGEFGGFYEYPAGGKKRIWSGLCREFPPGSKQPPLQELSDRFLHIQAIEAVRCLEDNVVESSRDANIGAVLGIGYPR